MASCAGAIDSRRPTRKLSPHRLHPTRRLSAFLVRLNEVRPHPGGPAHTNRVGPPIWRSVAVYYGTPVLVKVVYSFGTSVTLLLSRVMLIPSRDELQWGEVAERLVGAHGVVDDFPGSQLGAQLGHGRGRETALVELLGVSPLGALDGAVQFWTARRQLEQADSPRGAGGLEVGHELAAAVDLDRRDWERHPFEHRLEGSGGGQGGGAAGELEHVPATDHVAGGEVLEDHAGPRADVQGVDLDQVARCGHGVVARLADRVRPLPAPLAGADPPHGLEELAGALEVAQDASDHRDREHQPLAVQEHLELVLAPARILLAQRVDRLPLLERPGRLAPLVGTAETILERLDALGVVAPLPAIERLAADPKVAAGQTDVAAVAGVPVEPLQPLLGLARERRRRLAGQAERRAVEGAHQAHRSLRCADHPQADTLSHREPPGQAGLLERAHPTARLSCCLQGPRGNHLQAERVEILTR